ncbi:2-phospho-L-lactate guanylyltransferase [Allorhizobium pseudoryzae]|uniref:2-phospho-L-lactate guanylyltransferase n=1 Tax=Allorhizobium pseudoryzae TaxID=379684 RepID=UPI003D060214
MIFAVVPAKRLDLAKGRLSPPFSPGFRRGLAKAMLHDVLAALRSCSNVSRIILVTSDPELEVIGHGHGAVSCSVDADAGYSAAAAAGCKEAERLGGEQALIVPGDLPRLDARSLDRLAGLARITDKALVVPSRDGQGTNALLVRPATWRQFCFGPESYRRHLACAAEAGIEIATADEPRIALDIDQPCDLRDLQGYPASGVTGEFLGASMEFCAFLERQAASAEQGELCR